MRNPEPSGQTALDEYLDRFARLHRNVHRSGARAPHKPVLLLAVLHEIEHGALRHNLVEASANLVASFHAYWRPLVAGDIWEAKMVYPFVHLSYEGYWELVKEGQPLSTAGSPVHSLRQLAAIADGARLRGDLWQLLQSSTARMALRRRLMETYFPGAQDAFQTLPRMPINYEMDRMVRAAELPFRLQIRDSRSDAMYLQHALFPHLVRELYDDTCSVCGLQVRDAEGSSIVEAAHIIPYPVSHNDDPRNGIAMCSNHHIGFTRGWFGFDPGYCIIVSKRVTASETYVQPGAALRLPSDASCAPAREAIEWHRINRLDAQSHLLERGE